MADPEIQRFWALPRELRALAESFGETELLRVCEPYLALHCSSDGGNEPAGLGVGEALTADHPDDERREAALSVRASLSQVAGWRRVLAPDHICAGGFAAALEGGAGPLWRWASEEHYVRAEMLLASGASRFPLARQLSLDSRHAASASVAAARQHLRAAGRAAGCAPEAYEIEALRAACMRAARARFSQHAPSRSALLATGRALLTARTVWSPSALNLSAMAVRQGLLSGLPAPHPAGWWPVPALEHEGAFAPPVGRPRAAAGASGAAGRAALPPEGRPDAAGGRPAAGR